MEITLECCRTSFAPQLGRAMRKSIVLVGTIAGLSACGDSFSPSGVAGTYQLTLIDGQSMPATPEADITFHSGSIILREEGTWLMSYNYTVYGFNSDATFRGTFTLFGDDVIHFEDIDQPPPFDGFDAVIASGRLTFSRSLGGAIWVFER